MLRRSQQGVALAIVVWFLAAMSLLVAGIVFQARVDTRMAQTHLAKAKVIAAGDGAIQLMLGALKSNQLKPFRGRGVPTKDFELGGLAIQVHLVPTGGLVDLNGASKELLAHLFAAHRDASNADPKLLADNVVKWRSQTVSGTSEMTRFQSVEDLLRVDGINRTLLESVRDSVVANKQSRPGVDWMSAPQSVLQALSGENTALAGKVVEARSESFSPNRTMPRGLNPRFQSTGAGNEYRVDAIVTIGDKQWLRRRWVTMDADGGGLLPWRYTGTETARALSGIKTE